MNFPETYELISEDNLKEIGSRGYLLRHKKSGAHIALLDNDDENRVFCISFLTPPEDNCGVPHILEHSVLCGSEKYPLKDPFIELAKGSLNTFLNAMTGCDRTMYPVASINEKDFQNLMSVYMDAVFHPNIYREEKIFKQEGHHLEISDTGELFENGVVYNEMKGVFSDPDSVLERRNKEMLFPGTPYRYESGGDPLEIPSLTYETFLDYHRRHYHPGNSYIYLYGKLDFAERLRWLDENYLSAYEKTEITFEIPIEKAFDSVPEKELYYNASEESGDVLLSWSRVVDGNFSKEEQVAFEVLSYALLNTPGAPLQKALVKEGLATEVYGGHDTSFRQSIFNVVGKGGKKEDLHRFNEVIEKTLKDVVKSGIPKRTLKSGLHNIEFSMRESDFGRTPKGLVYGMAILDTWMFDETKTWIHLQYDETFENLRRLSETDYFEKLIETRLLNNTHGALILLCPEEGLLERNEAEQKKKYAELKSKLSENELLKLKEDVKELKDYQETPDTEETLRKLPLLSISDLSEEGYKIKNEEKHIQGVPFLYHDLRTSGISYLQLLLNLQKISSEELSYAALLKEILSLMDTKKHSYQELSDEISLYTGGLGITMTTYRNRETDAVSGYFMFTERFLYEDTKNALGLLDEIINETVFDDTKRMKEILQEVLTGMKTDLISSGHSTAVRRLLSYSMRDSWMEERTQGISFYRFVESLVKNFDSEKENLILKLKEVSGKIFQKENLTVSMASEKEGEEKFEQELPSVISFFGNDALPNVPMDISYEPENEYFKTFSQVQYAASGGDFRKGGFEYHGSMAVMKVLLGYEYLWQNVRVLGGAYGCMTRVAPNGTLAFVSYRDPHLKRTLDIYDKIPEFLKNLKLSERDLTKYIIGAIGELDTPMTPCQECGFDTGVYFTKLDAEELKRRRLQILHCRVEDLRKLSEVAAYVLASKNHVALGSEGKTEEAETIFKTITGLSEVG